MQSTRIVRGSHAALVFAACVGLSSPARTWADNPTDRQPVSCSVPDIRNGVAAASAARVVPPADSDQPMSRDQIQEAADQLLRELGAALQSLVFTAINWDLPPSPPPPPPETFIPLSVQPPPSLTDDPGNGPPPPPPPPPNNQSPEPGTLIAGLAGAGALLYRYRRRGTAGRKKEETTPNEVGLAM
jgi:hypothetical protein